MKELAGSLMPVMTLKLKYSNYGTSFSVKFCHQHQCVEDVNGFDVHLYKCHFLDDLRLRLRDRIEPNTFLPKSFSDRER